ncbi:Blp family class II bacteriocin [Bifidobacterium oedipodis]|uniref:Class IIb bacteriocin, lactobin A/cerein 7B family n=1 Tax=Bifidobacterium oedipodis TaxID=2675322 RepID=A0A7Y0HTM2_9BIFI|nr:Blp family class II bacteriocin [Bifidobacterium sp. DSM 109957]NMM94728.1 hypothetical protein [Bifidobacterium sp. DSM 109957]
MSNAMAQFDSLQEDALMQVEGGVVITATTCAAIGLGIAVVGLAAGIFVGAHL